MTPTSPERRAPSARRRFTLAGVAVVSCLTAVSVALGAAALERGPRVRGIDGDTDLLVERSGVTLVLRADQPLDGRSADGVRVEPEVPIDVDVSGSSLRVTFPGTVDFARDYRLIVPALRSRTTGAVDAAELAFTTPSLSVTSLVRGGAFARDGGDDRIVRHDLSSGQETTVLAAPRIQEYTDDGAGVVAAVLDDTGRASLVHGGDGLSTTPLALPGDGTLGLLRSSADAGRVGFVFTGSGTDGQQHLSTLFTIDPADPDAAAQAVLGVDGIPLQADAWFFVPGSTYLVAQAPTGTMSLVDATGVAAPRLLGEVGTLRGVLPGTTSLVVETPEGTTVLDLTTATTTPAGTDASDDLAAGSLLLSPETSIAWTADTVDRRAGGVVRRVFDADADARIEEVCVSPSGRHAAVGTVADDAVIDGYPTRAEWLGRTSAVVDLSTGEVVAEVPGTRPDWCA
ncbi:hypothetical protein ACO03V_00245 [Microbacterium sp. HMH0099]|uniref:hypothetical protein n=1 Tax=Microbacterium sp. HMH0099 TaxID=3414026 RepID=UPI003BF69436